MVATLKNKQTAKKQRIKKDLSLSLSFSIFTPQKKTSSNKKNNYSFPQHYFFDNSKLFSIYFRSFQKAVLFRTIRRRFFTAHYCFHNRSSLLFNYASIRSTCFPDIRSCSKNNTYFQNIYQHGSKTKKKLSIRIC